MKIVLGGPPRSGKSVLRHRLRAVLEAISPHRPYVLNTNPDGEGAWYQAAHEQDPEGALWAKQMAKQKWTDEHADLYASWVRNMTLPLVLLDVGGIVDDKNRRICAAATHAILIAPTGEALRPWQDFCAECGLTILAELRSHYEGQADEVEGGETPFRATIHRLERGELSTPRPAVEALAAHILKYL